MKISEVAGVVGCILVSQVLAPLRFLDLPSLNSIKIKDIKVRDGFTRKHVLHKGPDDRETVFPVHPEDPGPKTVLSLEDKYGQGHVILDHLTKTINSNQTSSWYVGDEGGSGDLGVAIFGFPSLIITSPILILNFLSWKIVELSTGMDRHQLSFYLRVRGQLDSDTQNLLKQSLKKLSK